jgi:hypothetical protein
VRCLGLALVKLSCSAFQAEPHEPHPVSVSDPLGDNVCGILALPGHPFGFDSAVACCSNQRRGLSSALIPNHRVTADRGRSLLPIKLKICGSMRL